MAVFTALVRLINREGKPQQKIVFRHSAPSLAVLARELNTQEVIVVDELIWEPGGGLREHEQSIISRRVVGKVRLWKCPENDAAGITA
jgi:hypothetical protein